MPSWDERDFIDDMLDGEAAVGTPERQALYDTMAKLGITIPRTIADVANAGTQLAALGGGNVVAGTSAAPAVQDMLVNAARANSSLPSESKPLMSIATPGAATTGVETPGVDVGAIVGALDPRLRRILGSTRAMRLQAEATSEHNAIQKAKDFQADVSRRFGVIEARLPARSLAAQQIRTVRVLLG